MSTRAMSFQYRAGSHPTTTPNTGFDPFGIQERRQQRTMTLQNQLEQQLMEMEQQHAKELEDIKAQHLKELTSSQQVTEIMKQAGLPDTPENRARMASELTDSQFALASQNAKNSLIASQMQEKSLNAKGSQEASDFGTRLKLSNVPFADLKSSAPFGGISAVPNVPGVSGDIGSGLGYDVLKGGTQQNTNTVVGQIPYTDPATGKTTMIGGKPIQTSRTSSGSFTPASANRPFSQQEIDAIRAPHMSLSATPQDGMNEWDQDYQNQVAPSPASGQNKNGNLSTVPPSQSPLVPQWPPRSGLIPGGYDVMGGGLKNLWQQYQNSISNPLYRLLMGNQ